MLGRYVAFVAKIDGGIQTNLLLDKKFCPKCKHIVDNGQKTIYND